MQCTCYFSEMYDCHFFLLCRRINGFFHRWYFMCMALHLIIVSIILTKFCKDVKTLALS
jgi:hypothetical protein